MISDYLQLLRRTSPGDLRCMFRELTTWRPMPRLPEPTMAMEDQAQVRAYATVVNANNGMTANHRLHAMHAVHRLARCRRVVDLACGPGGMLAMMAELIPTCEFIGVDQSDEMLATAEAHLRERRLGNVRLIKADITRLPFPDRWADGVMSTVALHHLPDTAALHACLREAQRINAREPAWYVVDLLRPRCAANVYSLSRRDDPDAPPAFTADFEHSWRAAFSPAEWTHAASYLSGCRLLMTAPVPLFTVLASAPVPPPPGAAGIISAGIVALSPAGRRTFDDLDLLFRMGGLVTPAGHSDSCIK